VRPIQAFKQRVKRTIRAVARELYVYGPADRVAVGRDVRLLNATLNTQGGTITIGDHTFAGHNVMILTGSHDVRLTGPERANSYRALQGRDIVIGAGVWLASGCIVLGPCRIGDNAVVAAGAVVTGDVPADTVVVGIPARPL
jgi:acetyltransferase-like isoleucine patch superfamily enzyme